MTTSDRIIWPILFSAPMVRALLEGRKTQTRRILKGAPSKGEFFCDRRQDGWWFVGKHGYPSIPSGVRFKANDLLWVREAWCPDQHGWDHKTPAGVHYRATDDSGIEGIDDGDGYAVLNRDGSLKSPWRPSIHMPRWASRLTLEVTDVRVQRLQDISEADARAEGIFQLPSGMWRWAEPEASDPRQIGFHTAVGAYDALWGQINGLESWPTNPWVVAITFTVHKANVDALRVTKSTATKSSAEILQASAERYAPLMKRLAER